MAFSTEVKDELAHLEVTGTCCRRAELAAIAKVDGTLHLVDGDHALEIACASAAEARRVVAGLHTLYGLTTEISQRRSLLTGSHSYLVSLEPQPKLMQALNDMGVIDDRSSIVYGILPRLVKRKCDAAAFLRGAFLAGGFVARPGANAHLELTTATDELAQDLTGLMARLDMEARLSRRRNLYAVYLKGNSQVARFLATVGAYKAVFAIEDGAVMKEMRANINRLVNCDTANVAKAVAAAADQVEAIKRLRSDGRLETAPRALKEVADVRLEYPEATVAELGEIMDPPLSKSAVYHRLRRLEKLAEGGRRGRAKPARTDSRPARRGGTA